MVTILSSILVASCLMLDPTSAQPSPATPPPPAATADGAKLTVATTSLPPDPRGINTADDLLSALEQAGKDLHTLQADMRDTKKEGEIGGGDEQVREGRLMFISEPGAPNPAKGASAARGRRMFQVDFTSTTVDNVRHAEEQTFIFDGEWFVEKSPSQKQIIKRQVVPTGEAIDPLAIGEGPFPIPIGQKRSAILERFDAELVPPEQAFTAPKKPEWLKDTYQLKLTPKRGTDEARQFREVRIWYRKDDLLPRIARTSDKDDSTREVFLTSTKLNEPLPPGAFDTTTPAGWDQDIQPYRKQRADE